VPAEEGETIVRIFNVNTAAVVHAAVRTPGRRVQYDGDVAIDGVPGTGAPIALNFLEAVGSKTGKLLPTGKVRDEIDSIAVSCVDLAMPMVIAKASDFGITGYETKPELDANKAMLKRMEEKKFDAYTGAWALPWSTDPFQVWHSSQVDVPKGSNRVAFRNKQADAIIEELRVTLDLDKRTELLRAFNRILYAEQPYSFMFQQKVPYCYRNTIRNVIYAKERPLHDIMPWWSAQAEG